MEAFINKNIASDFEQTHETYIKKKRSILTFPDLGNMYLREMKHVIIVVDCLETCRFNKVFVLGVDEDYVMEVG